MAGVVVYCSGSYTLFDGYVAETAAESQLLGLECP